MCSVIIVQVQIIIIMVYVFFHYLIHSKEVFDEAQINYMMPRHKKFSVDGKFGNSK